jgi:sugar (pentulose or hexulose) kinase
MAYRLVERGVARDDHGLVFLPFLGGERSIGWDPHQTGALLGLTFDTTPADIRRAALEGVGFRFAAIADLLPDVREIVATGGALVKDRGWVQLLADTLARPVTLSGIVEASLRGAAVAVLENPDDAPLGDTFHPREERAEAYRWARERQDRLYEVLRGEL